MANISEKMFNKIELYIHTHARPLDKRLHEFHFNNMTKEDVAIELEKYQNDDGGFGMAIEPDFRLPSSSALATTIGLQYASEIGLKSDHPIVQRAINYLLTTYDSKEQRWYAVPVEVNDFPHAPWWHVNPETKRSAVESIWANPNAEIVGYLLKYADLVPSSKLEELKAIALNKFIEDIEKMEMHGLLCYIRLFQNLPKSETANLNEMLQQRVLKVVKTSAEAWENYGPKPLTFSPSPNSILFPLLKEEIAKNIAYEIDKLKDDGYWEPNWSWGQYEDSWIQAKNDWEGYLTVKMIKSLHDYNYIAGK